MGVWEKNMAKTIGLQQLAAKVYDLINGLSPEIKASLGDLEAAFDVIIYGASGNGKTNFTVMLLKALLLAMPEARAEYISYEEAHGKTVQDCMIQRHNMLTEVGGRLTITDHLNYEELDKKMGRRQSAKIWIIDSLQASAFTFQECQKLKEKYVMSRKKKIIIYVSWSDGKTPKGSTAKAVEYYANIKILVDRLIAFPKSRYGGNLPFVIYAPGARAKWGTDYAKVTKPLNEFLKRNGKKETDVPKEKIFKVTSQGSNNVSESTPQGEETREDGAPVLLVSNMPGVSLDVEKETEVLQPQIVTNDSL